MNLVVKQTGLNKPRKESGENTPQHLNPTLVYLDINYAINLHAVCRIRKVNIVIVASAVAILMNKQSTHCNDDINLTPGSDIRVWHIVIKD